MFKHGKVKRSKKKKISYLLIILVVFGILLGGGVIVTNKWYNDSLNPLSASTEVKKITIDSGSSLREIATQLEATGLIRSAKAFETYVRRENIADQLKAGVFELSPSWSVGEIVNVLVSGKEASELLTIGPGIRLDQIRERFVKFGFKASEVDLALSATQYATHPALAGKPATASLEGYLYPESFRVSASTTPGQIISQSLDQLAYVITPDLATAIASQGLTTHEAITLASIVEKEVSSIEDRKIVAQIFLKRLKEGIALGSDATYFYASAVYGGEPFPSLDSPYNTRMYAGLPPGPINNVSQTSLEAIAYPASTNYLFFVTGDDGINHFTNTEAEHNEAIAKYCTLSCTPGYIPE